MELFFAKNGKGSCCHLELRIRAHITSSYDIQMIIEVCLLKLIYDRQSVGQSVLSRTRDQFYFLLEISFRQLRILLFCSGLSDERTGL
jgi:hypothetical protein